MQLAQHNDLAVTYWQREDASPKPRHLTGAIDIGWWIGFDEKRWSATVVNVVQVERGSACPPPKATERKVSGDAVEICREGPVTRVEAVRLPQQRHEDILRDVLCDISRPAHLSSKPEHRPLMESEQLRERVPVSPSHAYHERDVAI